MNKMMKRLVSCVVAAVLLVMLVAIPPEAYAVNDFYGDYTDVSKVYDYGSCPSMQGLAVGSTYMYTVKINSGNTSAFISMTHKDTGTTTKLYNADAGSYYFDYLGHANDMDVWGIDGYSNLFVATTNSGSNAIVRLKRSGNNLTKVASYSLTYNGAETCATALAVKSVSNGVITFITKLGMNLYTGSVSTSATSANIELTYLCTISKARVYIKGSYVDLSDYVNQGFGYYKDTLFVPVTGDSSNLNRSVIMVYDLSNAAGTIYPTEVLVFRVTSGAYSALFEIESCDICPTDGKLYFSTNRRKTTSDTNHDGISSFDDYTFETLPVDAPTSAPTYTIQYHANGGTGTMADTEVTYGTNTKLRSNSFTRTGYAFAGWTAYRSSQGQWRYVNGSSEGWYAEGSQPSGYTKYVYKDQTVVAKTTAVDGDVVHLYAQWVPNGYTITFADWDGTVLQSGTVSYGQMPTPPADPVRASDSQYSYTFAGWSPTVSTVTGTATYTATYTATALNSQTTATGKTEAYLDRVDSASELEEGVPYIISDYKNSWLHYVLTAEYAEKVSGSKTHKGYLLDGEPSVDTAYLWYIKDGNLVYGSADSDQYLLISCDSSSQGVVELGSYNAATAAYVSHYSGDDFAIRGTTHYLNRYGGTASDFVATAYGSAGGSYWHLDRLVGEQTVTLTVTPPQDTILTGGQMTLTPQVKLDGVAVDGYTLSWSSSDSAVASVSADGTVTALKAGEVTVTATLTAAGGRALTAPISVKIPLTVDMSTISASTVQDAELVRVSSLQTGVPYVITEWNSGAALTGSMLYTTSSGYKGLNGVQGLQTVSSYELDSAPVWYYDGTHLRYGSANGSYLVYNSSNQVALGTSDEAGIINKVALYSTSRSTFTMAPATSTSYLNQLGGGNYNVVGLYSSAYYSQWHFNRLLPQRTVSLSAAPGNVALGSGETVTVAPVVTVDGKTVSDYTLTWSSSDGNVAVVSSGGVITANNSGEAVITVKLTEADGRALSEALCLDITVRVTDAGGAGYSVTVVQEGKLVKTDSLQTGVPYVITESNTGAALTGTMVYTTDADYHGLNGTQGLKLVSGLDLNDAPVWYFDGTHLLYGTSVGSDNYLVCNSSNQVALGTVDEANIFDKVSLYNSAAKTFTIYPTNKSSGSTNYYLNQLGGGNYNAAGLYSYAPTSLWCFSEVVSEKTVSLNITPSVTELSAAESAELAFCVTVNGVAVTDCQLTWGTTDASVATVENGTVTAVSSGDVTITVTLTGADGDTFSTPVSIAIPITVVA